MIETAIETVKPFDKTSSYFVEVDEVRLVLKRFHKGKGPFKETLRATALPVGRYDVVLNQVVHRWDPATARDELVQHQQLQRMRCDEFRAVVKRIAKAVGGRVANYVDEDRGWIGYAITPKRGRKVDVVKLQHTFSADAVVVFTDVLEEVVGVLCADTFVDAVALARGGHLRPLFKVIEEECGITAIPKLDSRTVEVRTTRVPKNAARVVAALINDGGEGEGTRTSAQWKKELAKKKLWLWWDQ